jgi:dephospho-CoA kinase
MLLDLGASLAIDADQTVHALQRDEPAVRAAILQKFGPAVRAADGSIDRRALGAIAFRDPAALRQLEAIIHPAVRKRIREQLAALPAEAIVVVDAVKLLEGDLERLCESVWWVTARPEQQLQRLLDRGLDETTARARLAAQPALARWRDRVNVVIDNSGSVEDTRKQVACAFESVLAAHHPDGAGR